jgi:DNA-binding MarR family transcriptional regulator
MDATPLETAAELLEVVPQVMSAVRTQIRCQHSGGPSVPEFRALTFLDRHAGASLGDVADHMGLALPSMSLLVDGLVGRKLVRRESCPRDRRRVMLALTGRGRAILKTAYASTQAYLAQVLSALPPNERVTVTQAMRLLRPLFVSEREKDMLLAN